MGTGCLIVFIIILFMGLFGSNPALGVAVIIGIVILSVIINSNRKEEQQKTSYMNRKNADYVLKDFKIKTTKYIADYSFLISEGYEQLAIRYDGSHRREQPIILNMDNISKFELVQNDVIIREGGIGRAVVGGILAGGAGAVVGANTAKQTTQIEDISIKFTTKDINKPIIRVQLYGAMEKLEHSPKGTINQVDELIAVLNIIKEK